MKSALILGKGFVGTNLSNYFTEVDLDHEIYSRSMIDYTNPDKLVDFLESNKDRFHCVINTSGYTGKPNVDSCELNKKECWERNVINTTNIVKVSNDFKLPVIQVGSGCIYNGYEKDYTEEDEPNFGLFSDDSSFYSKCKHASEILLDNYCVYILRIRIPFTYKNTTKNYLTKLLNYNDLINESNSVTSISDLNNFIFRFLFLLRDLPGGIYNVVNNSPVKASDVIDIMKKNGIENANWNFIETSKLNTKAKRSNCVLSTKKIEGINLPLPNSLESIERDVKIFKNFI